jgi:hypothetical protein
LQSLLRFEQQLNHADLISAQLGEQAARLVLLLLEQKLQLWLGQLFVKSAPILCLREEGEKSGETSISCERLQLAGSYPAILFLD